MSSPAAPPEPLLATELFHIGATPVTVATLVTIALVLLATFALSTLLERLLARVLRARGKAGDGEVRALQRIVRYAFWLVGVGIALSTAGINLTALFAAGAVFAIALGFAMQNIAENFVAGVLLLLERAIKPGDVLEVEGQMVKVGHMGIRTTVARTLDDEDLVIPNSRLVQSAVKNYTLRDPQFRVRARVGVAYSSDMRAVEAALRRAAGVATWGLADPAPRVLLLEFGASSVDWEVSVWTDEPWHMRRQRSELQLAIWDALQEAGITIAFPQLDLHLDREVVERLGPAASPESR
ncbi:MAG: mechanosensitive ion channel [Acidobacteria bacterium]|nr:mechanosensitive ion channel [Acidobacteriota bacterium]